MFDIVVLRSMLFVLSFIVYVVFFGDLMLVFMMIGIFVCLIINDRFKGFKIFCFDLIGDVFGMMVCMLSFFSFFVSIMLFDVYGSIIKFFLRSCLDVFNVLIGLGSKEWLYLMILILIML